MGEDLGQETFGALRRGVGEELLRRSLLDDQGDDVNRSEQVIGEIRRIDRDGDDPPV